MRPVTEAYRAFLETKVRLADYAGFAVAAGEVHPALKDHQRAIVQWAAAGGRRAIFASFGLGKSLIQAELMRLCQARVGGSALITAPYGAGWEIEKDAREFLGLEIGYIRHTWQAASPGIYWTNYECVREGHVDPAHFRATSLDEADVLRSFGSKTYQSFLPLYASVPYRFVATATPSPNRFKELIHYAGYLGVMDTGQALTRFFMRDSAQAGNLQLLPHMEEQFWLWVSSWALFVTKPSDLGFSDEGYDLPPLDVRWHEVPVDHAAAEPDRFGQGALFRNAALGVAESARERRATMLGRIAKLTQLVAEAPAEHRVIWHDLEDERELIEQALPSAVSVYGAQPIEEKARRIRLFAQGLIQDLATKPVLAGAGTNLQPHCAWEIFVGVGFKFRDFIQAIHRIQRFGQRRRVRVDIIFAESERETRAVLEQKWRRHEELLARMTEIIRRYGLNQLQMADQLKRSIGVERIVASGVGWRAVNRDTVEECAAMPPDSVDLVVTSIPFSNQFEYTPSYNDFGHTEGDDQFFAQLDHLTPQLLRVLKPGRIAAIHVKDRILFGGQHGTGRPTVNPFIAKTMFHFMRHGFFLLGRHVIETDVVRENNQTYRLGYSEMLKDATRMGAGMPEEVLILAKPQSDLTKGYADLRVAKPDGDYSLARWQIDASCHWRSSGDRLLTPQEIMAAPPGVIGRAIDAWSRANVYDHETLVAIGEALEVRGVLPTTYGVLHPAGSGGVVWTDVLRIDTLNSLQAAAGREKHVCPLQLDVVERLVRLYSMPGETVLDPFAGIMSVPYVALKLGRQGLGVELSARYWTDGCGYLRAMEQQVSSPGLFDALDAAAEVGRAA